MCPAQRTSSSRSREGGRTMSRRHLRRAVSVSVPVTFAGRNRRRIAARPGPGGGREGRRGMAAVPGRRRAQPARAGGRDAGGGRGAHHARHDPEGDRATDSARRGSAGPLAGGDAERTGSLRPAWRGASSSRPCPNRRFVGSSRTTSFRPTCSAPSGSSSGVAYSSIGTATERSSSCATC